MYNKIIFLIGKKSSKFKLWYYKKTGKWLWGIIPWIKLFSIFDSLEKPITNWFKDEKERDSIINQIFNLKR